MPKSPAPRKRAPRRGYHHGDLKAALVESAVEILREQGLEALTLRAVARRAGVSQAAPYRHFADRRALVAAVAEHGFLRLQAAMHETVGTASGRAALKQVALAYVKFARENSAEYRVMFGPEVAITDDLPDLRHTARSVLGFVAEGIVQLQRAGAVADGDAWMIAVAIWSMLHGLVMLSLDGQAASVTPDLDALVAEATRIMMFGMAPRNAG
jgi:AcrR family transcriptional regulator